MGGDLSFEYLKKDGLWPNFTFSNLQRNADGSLTLVRVPRLLGEIGTGDAPPGAADTLPSGIATTPDCACDIYVSDPARHAVIRWDRCANEAVAPVCDNGQGSEWGQFDTPRGVAVLITPAGLRLYVADSANHRIVVIDVSSGATLDIWGQADPYGTPVPGSAPGLLSAPTALASDGNNSLYVLDSGNARVQKFSWRGEVDGAFWDALASGPEPPVHPINLTVSSGSIYILDQSTGGYNVLPVDPSGHLLAEGATPLTGIPDPLSIDVIDGQVYLGCVDGSILRVYRDEAGEVRTAGVVALKGRPVTALVAGCGGDLLAGSGGLPLARLLPEGGFLSRGYFYAGPFRTLAKPLSWHRWRVETDFPEEREGEAHLQLYTYLDSATPNPPFPTGQAAGAPFDTAAWRALPRDEADTLVLSAAVRSALEAGPESSNGSEDLEGNLQPHLIWVGGVLWGDGRASPTIHGMRLDYSPPTYARYLPAIYRQGPRRRLFTELALALLGSEIGLVEEKIDALPQLFDPGAAPPDWLSWLAGWLDFDLVEEWPEADKRARIAEAAGLYGYRGTREGLRRYLKIYLGVDSRVEDINASVALFALDENVSLGFNTVLAPAEEGGAVLGTTATLGGSHLLNVEDTGVPLFEDIAHRFTVEVYASQLEDTRTLQGIRDVIEREKPAHTDYHLCVIEPTMRVGWQARLGIDTIVAGEPLDLHLGEDSTLDEGAILANRPRRSHRLGEVRVR